MLVFINFTVTIVKELLKANNRSTFDKVMLETKRVQFFRLTVYMHGPC